MLVGITEASEASLAVAPLMQRSDEHREIWQVPRRDLGRGRQMLQGRQQVCSAPCRGERSRARERHGLEAYRFPHANQVPQ
jgi:hypothetical protein